MICQQCGSFIPNNRQCPVCGYCVSWDGKRGLVQPKGFKVIMKVI